jgi:type VI secretion system protein ImpL
MVQGHGAREEHVGAVRRRLDELNVKLGIQLPVYLLVTKCDLVAGFTEYFDDLTQEGRAQVWGVTFPYEQTRNSQAAQAFPEEFDALMTRLNERVFPRVQEEGDPRRRAKAFGFPQQMAALRGVLSEFVSEIFGSTRFDKSVLLRGVYFTSGTQEGTPIDRLLGAIGRRFAVAPDAVLQSGRGKAYFIERLLKEVMIPESGLAGLNRRLEVQKAASQLGAYVAMAAVAVLGVIALSVSYGRNRAYLGDVQAAVMELQKTPAVPENASVELMLPRLGAVQRVYDAAAKVHNDGAPLSMRWGLYQGGALSAEAREAYVDVLNGPLLTRVAERFRERFIDFASEPLILYGYVKGYLMLLKPREHFDADHLRSLAEAEWKMPSAEESETGPLMLAHFNSLLDQPRGLRPLSEDAATRSLINTARSTIRQASIAHLAYRQLVRASEADRENALSLSEKAGLRAEEVLRRKDGVSLSTPMLSVYTKKIFEQVTAPGAPEKLIKQLADEQWVWGDEGAPKSSGAQLVTDLLAAYEADYIRQWDLVVNNLDQKRPADAAEAARVLAILADQDSPLRNLLRTIDENTFLVKPEEAAKSAGGLVDKVQGAAGKVASYLPGGKSASGPADQVRLRITLHFAGVHKLVAGEGGGAPIDRVLQKLGELQKKVEAVGPQVGKNTPLDPATQAGISTLASDLKAQADGLGGPIGAFVNQVTGSVTAIVVSGARGDLTKQYVQEVVIPCRQRVDGAYPLMPGAPTEATPEDFGAVFGFDGVFDRFFKSTLDPHVNTATRPWTWRESLGGATVGTVSMLRQFELARQIRDNFFRPGSQMLEVQFRATSIDLDAETTKFTLKIDGQSVEDNHGPTRSVAMTWPGKGEREAVATFLDRSAVPPTIQHGGNWAFLRLLADAGPIEKESESRFVITLQKGGHSARVRLEAVSNLNPIGRRDMLQQFRCSV